MATTKHCPRCKFTKPVQEFYKNVARRDGLSPYCVECQRGATNDSYLKLKERAIAYLGGKCKACGYDSDVRALVIDHVYGGGGLERKAGYPRKVLNDVLSSVNRGRYQLLCANCNVIKRCEMAEYGTRAYRRAIPTERIIRPNQRWTDETRAAQALRTRQQWADPEHRARVSEKYSIAMKRRWATSGDPTKPQTVTM